jgi:hypothetical protein
MKRLGLSLALPVFGLLAGVLAPSTASAHGFGGGGHAGGSSHGGGAFHGAPAFHGSAGFHGAPAFHAGVGGGWRGGPAHVATPARGYVGYGARPAYGYGARPAYGYGGRAYYGAGPAAGYWGWHGATRVWIGGSVAPYAGWGWSAGQWVWSGNQWVWQDGYWAPPAY